MFNIYPKNKISNNLDKFNNKNEDDSKIYSQIEIKIVEV